eukprot:9167475-Pyramimonas_sp.AAC.1
MYEKKLDEKKWQLLRERRTILEEVKAQEFEAMQRCSSPATWPSAAGRLTGGPSSSPPCAGSVEPLVSERNARSRGSGAPPPSRCRRARPAAREGRRVVDAR